MNERIRELIGQAKFMAEETINKQISKNAELDAFAEKFVELIVRKCASMARAFHSHEYDFTGNLELDEFMLKHFGVEK